jgi:hypothetical protein
MTRSQPRVDKRSSSAILPILFSILFHYFVCES